ncbi:hypothetical protein LJR267_009496 [Paraburkholderia hospita]|uniref:hypothetical protein n=1 Tax=Paraburkholderia hospita TaxID=169430 RepID=UPI003ECDA268
MSKPNYPTNTAGTLAFAAAVAACVFVILIPAGLSDGFFLPALTSALAAFTVEFGRRTRIRKLVERRDEVQQSGSRFEVIVNDARVGEIGVIETIDIKLNALSDARNYAAQFMNLLAFLIRCALLSLVLTPVLLFWAFVFQAWIDPSGSKAIMSSFLQLQPASVMTLGTTLITFCMTVFMLTVGCSISFGPNLGLSNMFRRAVDRAIAAKLECPVPGRIRLRPARPVLAAVEETQP